MAHKSPRGELQRPEKRVVLFARALYTIQITIERPAEDLFGHLSHMRPAPNLVNKAYLGLKWNCQTKGMNYETGSRDKTDKYFHKVISLIV